MVTINQQFENHNSQQLHNENSGNTFAISLYPLTQCYS